MILRLSLVAMFSLMNSEAWALDPAKPPKDNFILNHWYLGLPVNFSGVLSGTTDSASVTTSQLINGVTNAYFNGFTNAYFYTGADGSLVFWAPVTGATTSGSSNPRSELRELLYPPSTTTNWNCYGLHTLDAQCKVLAVPSSLKVIIGQIHSFLGPALPLVKIQYSSGKIEALVKTNANNDASDYKFTYANVGLSNTITYQIKVLNGLISIAVNGVTNSMNVFQTDPDWATNTQYFKAGSYCQDFTGASNEGSRVAFYSVSLFHAPSITNQPTGRVVLAGSNTTLTVSALGSPTFKYNWRLNGTNISSATNASLTLTNLQTTNAGNYTVVVTDLAGVVTSSVAGLVVNHAPAPGMHYAITRQGKFVSLPVAKILQGDSDADGNTMSISNVTALSTNNGTVTLATNYITYTPPGNYLGKDRLSYILSDTYGATNTGFIFVTVVSSNASLVSLTNLVSSNGNCSATYAGVANYPYTIDRATNVAGPWTLGFTNITSDASGIFKLIATNSPPAGFFRARYP